MTSQKEHFVRKRFKDHEEILVVLLHTDPEFTELCEEYEICVKASEYWSSKRDPEARGKADEFRSIATDLEMEISRRLAKFKS